MTITENAKAYHDNMFPGCQSTNEFRAMAGASPVEIKEPVYQSAANMGIGNDKAFLIQIISQCLPFMGYPRSRNALHCVNKAANQ